MDADELLAISRKIRRQFESSEWYRTIADPCYDSEYTHCDEDMLTTNLIAEARENRLQTQGHPLEPYFKYRYSMYLYEYLAQGHPRPIPIPKLFDIPQVENTDFSLDEKIAIVKDICNRIDNLDPENLAKGITLDFIKHIVRRLLLPHEDTSTYEALYQIDFWKDCRKDTCRIPMQMGGCFINMRPIFKMLGSFANTKGNDNLISYERSRLAADFLGDQNVLLHNNPKTKEKVLQVIGDAQRGKFYSMELKRSISALRSALNHETD